jgi:hypothetical protein
LHLLFLGFALHLLYEAQGDTVYRDRFGFLHASIIHVILKEYNKFKYFLAIDIRQRYHLYMATSNQYQLAARMRKASKLASHLRAYNILACDVPRISTKQWAQLASVVGVNAPSTETIALVDELLRDMEAAKRQAEREQGDAVVDLGGL